MSTDEKITKDLVQTLEDGKNGFASAAEKVGDSDDPALASKFREFSHQREQFASELRGLAQAYGDEANESGSIAGAAHRAWIGLKDALTGSDPTAVLKAVEQGEEHAVSEYEKALQDDISAGLRTVVERQLGEIRQALATVRAHVAA